MLNTWYLFDFGNHFRLSTFQTFKPGEDYKPINKGNLAELLFEINGNNPIQLKFYGLHEIRVTVR